MPSACPRARLPVGKELLDVGVGVPRCDPSRDDEPPADDGPAPALRLLCCEIMPLRHCCSVRSSPLEAASTSLPSKRPVTTSSVGRRKRWYTRIAYRSKK